MTQETASATPALNGRDDGLSLTASDFAGPRIQLVGDVAYAMYQRFRDQLERSAASGLVVVEVSTLGGDPEVARMMGEDIRFETEVRPERRLVFLGKAVIYSAGATFMSFFAPGNRYLARGARLMIHERKLDKTVHLAGPLTSCVATATALLHEIEHSILIQNEGFANLIQGSTVSLDDVLNRAPGNWYVEAQEALALGLVRGGLVRPPVRPAGADGPSEHLAHSQGQANASPVFWVALSISVIT